jgi:hypothetical protein
MKISKFIVECFLIKAIVVKIFICKVKGERGNLKKITYLYINPLKSRRFFNKHLIRYNPLILKHLFVRRLIFSYYIYNNKIYKIARNYSKIGEVLALLACAALLTKQRDT